MSDNLPERLLALAETLVGDEWEHPVDAVDTCRRAADELERLTRRPTVEPQPPTYGPCPNGCGRRTQDPDGDQCDECWREDDLDFGDNEEREIAR